MSAAWAPPPDRYGKPRTDPITLIRKDTTMTVQTDTLTALADQLARVQAQLTPLREQEAALKAEIRSSLASLGPGEYMAGDHLVVAGATRRIDNTLIEQRYPATTHPQFYKLVVDTTAVRKNLAPAVVDDLMKIAGDLAISVR